MGPKALGYESLDAKGFGLRTGSKLRRRDSGVGDEGLFRVWGLGYRGIGFRVWGLGFWVKGLGYRVYGIGFGERIHVY